MNCATVGVPIMNDGSFYATQFSRSDGVSIRVLECEPFHQNSRGDEWLVKRVLRNVRVMSTDHDLADELGDQDAIEDWNEQYNSWRHS